MTTTEDNLFETPSTSEVSGGNDDANESKQLMIALPNLPSSSLPDGLNHQAPTNDVASEEVTCTGVVSGDPVNVIFLDSLPIFKRPLRNQEVVIANRRDEDFWCRAAILQTTYSTHPLSKQVTRRHKVHYEDGVRPHYPLSLDEIAYSEVCRKLIPFGAPVVIDISDGMIKYSPGVVIETPTLLNKHRYVVLSSKGTARYVEHSEIRIIAGSNLSMDSDDFDPQFLQDHKEIYPNYVAIKMKPGQEVSFFRKNKWTKGKVISVDCSIVLILFADGEVESYHRGCYRNHRLIFEPLSDAISKLGVPRLKRLRDKFKLRIMPAPCDVIERGGQKFSGSSGHNRLSPLSTISLARNRPNPAQCLRTVTPLLKFRRQPAGLHHCDETCAPPLEIILGLDPKIGPLIRPLHLGFKRELGGKHGVLYRAPCGQCINGFEELNFFLKTTGTQLAVTNFDFNQQINPKRVFVPDPEFVFAKIDDISEGYEVGGISVVNEFGTDLPDAFIYQNKRVFPDGRGVDTDFVSCCSCEDNCEDSAKCDCSQLTVDSYLSWNHPNNLLNDPSQIGYQYKRLLNEIPTGIYECNDRCKCNASCPRRLVQFPSEVKLQLFNTIGKGWGVRTLYDLPKGTMISVYVGTILNEYDAERWGVSYGDDYLTDLDFIHKTESRKPDYEDGVPELNGTDSTADNPPENDAQSSTQAVSEDERKRGAGPKLKKRKKQTTAATPPEQKMKSLRNFFPKGETEFTIDAKLSGNISKYFNHSCNPNMFVQNVFVDTHDPRLPWAAYFTKHDIIAGTELTWDYDYVIGSVKGRAIPCVCKEPNCRKRLI